MSEELKETKLWEDYRNCQSYRDTMGYYSNILSNINFYEGRQWGEIKKGTERLPRITFNQIEMIVDNKVSNIFSSPTSIKFFCKDNQQAADELTEFNTYMEKELKVERVSKQVVKQGAIEASTLLHVFWNAEKVGKRGEYEGGIETEIIDALHIGYQNPRECDIQKQKWVIIETREDVDEVKRLCDNDAIKELICPDQEGQDRIGIDQEGSNLVTVLTRYFRKDGEVFFEKGTRAVIFQEARALNPKLNEKLLDEEYDSVDADLPDKPTGKETDFTRKASLYPLALYKYKERKDCIYGRSEVETLRNNNTAINFNASMMCLAVENQAFGKLVAKEGALDINTRLTNDPSKVLIDKYKGGQGLYALPTQPFSPQAMQLNNDIMDVTRTVTGSTEVMTGETMGANQSGTSIAYLQQQAQKQVTELVKTYRRWREDLAEVLLQFYVLFYTDKEYIIEPKDDTEQETKSIFNGSQYGELDFTITIEAGAGTQYSEIAGVNMLDNLLNAGAIDVKTYLKAYPDNILGNKNELLKSIEEQEQSQIVVMGQQLQQATIQLEQATQVIQQQNNAIANVKTIVAENKKLNEELAQLVAEYTNKINAANQVITETRNDAQQLATDLYYQQNGGKYAQSTLKAQQPMENVVEEQTMVEEQEK